ncbi:hypothetical protein [Streptomyces sp. NPDC058548]|uniref:hypothetical protein n=1 Tax=Streptomyces sp. NPDC058548 TaxID=3346545 RepID=UPI003651D676
MLNLTSTEYLWWGDGWGDRPSEAAVVADQLPDNLGATINMREHWKAPEDLTKLSNEEHQREPKSPARPLAAARRTAEGGLLYRAPRLP